MRRLAVVLVALAAVTGLCLLEAERGRAREPGARRAEAPRTSADILASAEPEEPTAKVTESALSGTVVDDAGKPLPGARVRVFAADLDPETWRDAPPRLEDPLAAATTDAQGRFRVVCGDATERTLVAEAEGLVPAFRHVRRGAAVGDCSLVLRRAASRSVRVVDPDGMPLADAEALVFQGTEALRAVVRPDADGWIDADLVPKELLLVRAPGRAWELVEPPLDPPEVVLDIEHRIGGVVVTGDGLPAAGVRLSFERYLWTDHVVTGADGRFLVGGLGENEVELIVAPPGREWLSETVQPGDERLRIVVPTARVEGVVLFPDGRPAPGASIDPGGIVCDDQGRFALDDVLPGDTWIQASFRAPGVRLKGCAHLVVGGEDVTGVCITLAPAPLSFVRVSVVGPDGKPVVAHVGARTERWWVGKWYAAEAGSGTLEIDALPGTEVALTGEELDPRPGTPRLSGKARAVTDASREGPVVTLRLDPPVPERPPVVVTIVCREADGSALPAHVEIRVWIQGLPSKRLDSDGPGRQRFRVAAGATDGVISVYAPGYAPAGVRNWTSPVVDASLEIRLRPAVRVVGRVVDPEAPAADDIDFTYSGDFSWSEFEPGGRFALDAAPGQHLEITARRGRVPGVVLNLEVPATGTLDLGDLRLEKPWILRGTVLDEDGAPAGGATVTVGGPGYDGKTVTRGDGTFRLEAPPSELYEVHAEKDQIQSERLPASTFLREAQALRLRSR